MVKVRITFSIENDFESDEITITIPASKDFVNRLKNWDNTRKDADSACISAGCIARDLCNTAAIMMGYSLVEIENVEVV